MSLASQEKVAILLNGRAKSVTADVIQTVRDGFFMSGKVFVSHELAEVPGIVSTILAEGYDTVLTGGGDGTFTITISEMVAQLKERSPLRAIQLPRFGLLKLGTGNALAWMVGASRLGQKGHQLRKLPSRTTRIRLVETEGIYAPFSGAGADAQILSDYAAHKSLVKDTLLTSLGSGLTGYALAGMTRSLPHFIAQSSVNVQIINKGQPAYRISRDGIDEQSPIEAEGVLYEGPMRLCGFGTIPYYGFKMKMFPYALSHPERMHLRVTSMGPLSFLTNLRSIWRGDYEDEGKLHDFLVERVSIKLSHQTPVQIGGDPHGACETLDTRVSPFEVELLNFTQD